MTYPLRRLPSLRSSNRSKAGAIHGDNIPFPAAQCTEPTTAMAKERKGKPNPSGHAGPRQPRPFLQCARLGCQAEVGQSRPGRSGKKGRSPGGVAKMSWQQAGQGALSPRRCVPPAPHGRAGHPLRRPGPSRLVGSLHGARHRRIIEGIGRVAVADDFLGLILVVVGIASGLEQRIPVETVPEFLIQMP